MGYARSRVRPPRRVAREVARRLEALADPQAAARGRTFFKQGEAVTLYGVRGPAMRSLAREIYSQVKQSSNETHAIELCDILARHDHFEAKMVDVLVLSRYHRQFPRHLLETSRRWIEAGWFANWAAIDGLCPNILTPLIQRYPEYLPRVTQWVRSRDRWLRRTCLITLLPLARRGRHLDESYAAVAELLDDPEDLIHKACGWLLREAGRADLHRRRLLVQTRN